MGFRIFKSKKVLVFTVVIASLALAVIGVAVLMAEPPPSEPIPLKVTGLQVDDVRPVQNGAMALSSFSLDFATQSVKFGIYHPDRFIARHMVNVDVKIGGDWQRQYSSIPRQYMLTENGSATEVFSLVVPGNVKALRFEVEYFLPPSRLLGIGNPQTRQYPPSKISAWAQGFTKAIWKGFYDRIWPSTPRRWQTSEVVGVNLKQGKRERETSVGYEYTTSPPAP